MGRVISFSEFNEYYSRAKVQPGIINGAIFDTTILVALNYEVGRLYEEVTSFFDSVLATERDNGMRFFTTVNTRSEFLDFFRRVKMTENLRDLIDDSSKWRISTKARAQIQYQSGQLKRREHQGSDPVFTDGQIKAIKSSFSAGRFSGQESWLYLCDRFLNGRLDEIEDQLSQFGVVYISQHIEQQKDLFASEIT